MGVIPRSTSNIRSLTTQRNITTQPRAIKMGSEQNKQSNDSWYTRAAIFIGATSTVFFTYKQFHAEETTRLPSYKEHIFGKYENRIREMSAPEKIFEYFASVKNGKESLMTPADFVRAITPYNYKRGADVGPNGSKYNENPKLNEPLLNILKVIDTNGDGLISFSEFIFFSTLLSIPTKYFRYAFNLFDEDGNGSISANEFKNVMRLLRQSNPLAKAQRSDKDAIDSAGVFPEFFGEDGKDELDFERFEKFLTDLRTAVLQVQFRMIEGKDGTISARDYATNLASYGNLRHMSEYLSRAAKLRNNPARITFEEYQAFNTVLESLTEINFALSSFVSMGEPFTKEQLRRAALAVADVHLSDNLLDIVFFLFDKDGDGLLDYHEFVGVLEGRQSFGFSKPRDSGVVRFTTCLKQCWEEENYNYTNLPKNL